MFELMLLLVVVGTSIWVLSDASSLGVHKGLVPGNCDYGPGGWFFICLLLWIVGFPVYLSMRPKFIAALEQERHIRERPPTKPQFRDPVEEWERKKMIQEGRFPPKPKKTVSVSTVDCPLCNGKISAAAIRIGHNTCPECQGEFKAESE